MGGDSANVVASPDDTIRELKKEGFSLLSLLLSLLLFSFFSFLFLILALVRKKWSCLFI